MKLLKISLLIGAFSAISFANMSYNCLFTKRVSYSGIHDTTPNRTKRVHMSVIYRVVGNELLTRPKGVDRTYSARLYGKWLDRFGDLYYIYKSKKGYIYGFSLDNREVIEMTPSGKTVLYGKCHPIY